MEIIGIARHCHSPTCQDGEEWPLLPGDDAHTMLANLRRRAECPECGAHGDQVQYEARWTRYPGPGKEARREWPEGCYFRWEPPHGTATL